MSIVIKYYQYQVIDLAYVFQIQFDIPKSDVPNTRNRNGSVLHSNGTEVMGQSVHRRTDTVSGGSDTIQT